MKWCFFFFSLAWVTRNNATNVFEVFVAASAAINQAPSSLNGSLSVKVASPALSLGKQIKNTDAYLLMSWTSLPAALTQWANSSADLLAFFLSLSFRNQPPIDPFDRDKTVMYSQQTVARWDNCFCRRPTTATLSTPPFTHLPPPPRSEEVAPYWAAKRRVARCVEVVRIDLLLSTWSAAIS